MSSSGRLPTQMPQSPTKQKVTWPDRHAGQSSRWWPKSSLSKMTGELHFGELQMLQLSANSNCSFAAKGTETPLFGWMQICNWLQTVFAALQHNPKIGCNAANVYDMQHLQPRAPLFFQSTRKNYEKRTGDKEGTNGRGREHGTSAMGEILRANTRARSAASIGSPIIVNHSLPIIYSGSLSLAIKGKWPHQIYQIPSGSPSGMRSTT